MQNPAHAKLKSRTRWASALWLLPWSVLGGWLFGCIGNAADYTTGGLSKRPNILLLVIDALRADHVSGYGYSRLTTPELDGLAKRGTLFRNAHSSSNYTLAAVPSILTGFLSSTHGVQREGDSLPEELETLAERLRRAGYRTAAWAPNPTLHRRFGFDQGFDLYDDRILKGRTGEAWERFETASRIHEGAWRFLHPQDARPFFLYLHYRDVHGPYVPPPDYRDLFFPADQRGSCKPLDERDRAARPEYLSLEDGVECLDYYIAQYDASIRYTDAQIGGWLRRLDAAGFLAHTWLVITADHGESFLERGHWNHGNDLFEEEIHVPLIVVPPASYGPIVPEVSEVVQGTDLYPTVLEMTGLRSASPVQGRSLLPLLSGKSLGARATAADGHRRIALREGPWKLLWLRDERRFALFDLESDPGEKRDLRADAHPTALRLRRQANRLREVSSMLALRFPRQEVGLDDELSEALRSLGYLK